MKHTTAVIVAVLGTAFAVAPARAEEAPPAPQTPKVDPSGTVQAAAPSTSDATPAGPPSPLPAPNETGPAAPEAPQTPAPAPAPDATPSVVTPPTPPTKALSSRATQKKTSESAKPKAFKPLLGLGLAAPDTGTLPGRFRPSYGVQSISPSDYRFDFHGYLLVPFRMGTNERKNPLSTQYTRVFHAPPLTPDDFERFEHTGVIPQPWVQLGFSYGNSRVVANIIIAARSVSNASGYLNPPTELGINDAFVTFKPDFGNVDVEINVGGFANRYGAMGDYDTGRYDTPVIARIGGVGETLRINVPVRDDLTFLAEHGIMSQFDRAPLGVEPAGWNSFADPNVGTSFAQHAHLGLAMAHRGQVGLHYVNAWTRDDRTAPAQPDGSITVLGADVTGGFAPFGRLYLGVAHTHADTARGVSGVIRVLNTFGGPGLMREYLGPNSGGTGNITTVGGQYDVSIGEAIRSPGPYSGYAPDLFASVFGMWTHVSSNDKTIDPSTGKNLYDGVSKLKYGAEVTYSALAWLALSGRYDRVVANVNDDSRTFAVLSPRVILRSDYNSQDQVAIQYSRWFYGSGVAVRTGYPPVDDPSVVPDASTFSLTASMWW